MRDGTAPETDRAAGVTLIEVLVVLALVAVLAGSVSLALGRIGRADRLAESAALLVSRLQTVADASVQSGAVSALLWDRDSYGFAMHWDGAWQPAQTAFPPKHDLPDGTILIAEGSPYLIDGRAIPANGLLTLRLEAGARVLRVTFDGLTARVMAAERAP